MKTGAEKKTGAEPKRHPTALRGLAVPARQGPGRDRAASEHPAARRAGGLLGRLARISHQRVGRNEQLQRLPELRSPDTRWFRAKVFVHSHHVAPLEHVFRRPCSGLRERSRLVGPAPRSSPQAAPSRRSHRERKQGPRKKPPHAQADLVGPAAMEDRPVSGPAATTPATAAERFPDDPSCFRDPFRHPITVPDPIMALPILTDRPVIRTAMREIGPPGLPLPRAGRTAVTGPLSRPSRRQVAWRVHRIVPTFPVFPVRTARIMHKSS